MCLFLSSMSDEGDLSTCTICMEDYTISGAHVPRILPCHHTVCDKCLSTLLVASRRMVCPECRAEHPAPEQAKSFPQNKYILSHIASGTRTGSKKKQPGEWCAAHGKEMALFCEESQCNRPLCVGCIGQHKGHLVAELEAVMGVRKRQLAQSMKNLSQQLTAERDILDQAKWQLFGANLACYNQITSHRDKQIKHIRDTYDRIIHKSEEKRMEDYTKIMKEAKEVEKNMRSVLEVAQSLDSQTTLGDLAWKLAICRSLESEGQQRSKRVLSVRIARFQTGTTREPPEFYGCVELVPEPLLPGSGE